MAHASDLGATRFNGIAMMFDRFGVDILASAWAAVRAAAGAAALALTQVAARRAPAQTGGANRAGDRYGTHPMSFDLRTSLGHGMALAAALGVSMVCARCALAGRGPGSVRRPQRAARTHRGNGSHCRRTLRLKLVARTGFVVRLVGGRRRPWTAPRAVSPRTLPTRIGELRPAWSAVSLRFLT